MYSVVMMMALSGGAEVPQFGFRNRGCNGCAGTVACHGCSGYASQGCAGYACHGCSGYTACQGYNGSACSGRQRGGFLKKMFGGRNRGCRGSSGCHGTVACHGCHGAVACHGCHGAVGCHGYTGCHGAVGCHGADGCHGGVIIEKTKSKRGKKLESNERKKRSDTVSAPARLVVTLPENAKLFVDNRPTTSTGDRRVFQSPTLPNGSSYSYTLRAEMIENGQTTVQSQTVSFRAGETRNVEFSFSQGAVASGR